MSDIPPNWMRFFSRKCFALVASLSFSVCSINVQAVKTGVAPYLTEKLSPSIELEVERLASIAGIPNLTRPYNIATIFHYLDQIRVSHPGLYSRLSMALRPYERRFSITHASVAANYSDQDLAWANHRGNDIDTLGFLSLRGQWQPSDWLGFYGGGYLTNYRDGGIPDDTRVSNASYVSMGVQWAQLDIGYRDFWLSPFQGGSQLLSTHAESMPSITLSNNLPFEFWGARWNYQSFLAEMGPQDVLYQGEYTGGNNPLIAGLHLSVQPTPWWTIGATRLLQFSGGKRPRDLETMFRAFLDPRGSDNVGEDLSQDEQAGNQLAALSSKLSFDGRVPFTFSAELGGEDTNNNKDYQLGNTSVTAGLFFPYFFTESMSFSFEYSDWQKAWYSNSVYSEGFTNEGYVLGTWAMQEQREMLRSNAGRSYYMGLHYQFENDHILYTQIRTSEPKGITELSSSWELEVDYSFPLKVHVGTLSIHVGKDNFGEDFSRASIALEW